MTDTRFNYTGHQQLFTVPDQCHSILATMVGGTGGNFGGQVPGGKVIALFDVTPGQTLYLNVGGSGNICSKTADALGGFNGGGKAYHHNTSAIQAGSGGGASDIRIGGTALSNRVLIAGGGGGSGASSLDHAAYTGGSGGFGGPAPAHAGNGGGGGLGGNPGLGGTASAGGPGGTGLGGGDNGHAGALGVGGDGSSVLTDNGGSGGGGGGGRYGGGGGAQGGTGTYGNGGGGGGGGSNYIAATINGSASVTTSNTTSAGEPPYILLHYNVKPTVTAIKPDSSHNISNGATTYTFDWDFQGDFSPTQKSYQVVVEDYYTGAVVYDSGTVVSSSTQVAVNVSSWTDTWQFRWKIRATDQYDAVSDYTTYLLFSKADVPSFTLIPTDGTVLTNARPTVNWSNASFSGSWVQDTAVVTITRDADSSVVRTKTYNDATTRFDTALTDILKNSEAYTITVKITDSGGLSTTHTSHVTTSFTQPIAVNYIVTDLTNDPDFGYVDISWPGTAIAPDWIKWRVYRRLLTDDGWTLLLETTDLNVHDYHDWMVRSGYDYQYNVTQTAIVSSDEVESPVGYRYDSDTLAEIVDMNVYHINVEDYWIIDVINEKYSVQLYATSAPMTDNYEEELYTLIGRGQKKDYGTRLGYSGTLSVQLRGYDGRPALTRQKLEALKMLQDTYYLRSPFGDLFIVGLGVIEFTPLAGTSTAAMYDVTIPFDELSGIIVSEIPAGPV